MRPRLKRPSDKQRKSETRIGEPLNTPDGPFVKTDITPEDFFKAWSRKDKEALVEVLISSLDQADGDSDLEPLLGAPEVREYHERRGHVWARGATDDREGDPGCDDREDVCEDEGSEHDGSEPSLGWTDGEAAAGGRVYAGSFGSGHDLEDEHDGSEPDVDDEPSIGGDDREWDDAERSGIGDVEGLLEQTEFGGGCGAAGFAVAVE